MGLSESEQSDSVFARSLFCCILILALDDRLASLDFIRTTSFVLPTNTFEILHNVTRAKDVGLKATANVMMTNESSRLLKRFQCKR